MSNPYRAVRQFERLLFRGVPEQPEALWTGHGHVNERETGRSLSGDEVPAEVTEEAVHWATVVYDTGPTAASGEKDPDKTED